MRDVDGHVMLADDLDLAIRVCRHKIIKRHGKPVIEETGFSVITPKWSHHETSRGIPYRMADNPVIDPHGMYMVIGLRWLVDGKPPVAVAVTGIRLYVIAWYTRGIFSSTPGIGALPPYRFKTEHGSSFVIKENENMGWVDGGYLASVPSVIRWANQLPAKRSNTAAWAYYEPLFYAREQYTVPQYRTRSNDTYGAYIVHGRR